MTLRRIAYAAFAVLLLVPFSSCRLAAFDQDGDGTVTREEIVATLDEFFCGDDEPAPTTPDEGTPTDGSGTPDNGGTPDQGSTPTP